MAKNRAIRTIFRHEINVPEGMSVETLANDLDKSDTLNDSGIYHQILGIEESHGPLLISITVEEITTS